MILKRAAVVAAFAVLAGTCLADGRTSPEAPDARSKARSGNRPEAPRADDVITIDDREIRPWTGPRKMPSFKLEMDETSTGELRIKFTNSTRARMLSDRTTFRSENGVDLDGVKEIFQRFNLVASPAFRRGAIDMQALEARALARGFEPPDLRGMYILNGPRGSLLTAARALNDLELVEWVEIVKEREAFGGAVGACCLPGGGCLNNQTPASCAGQDGFYQGDGVTCPAVPTDLCSGACCFQGGDGTTPGVCADQTFEDCANAGGVFQDFGMFCAATTCPAACCLPDDTCTIVTEADCMAATGEWQELRQTCAANACDGACCFATVPGVPPCQLRRGSACIAAGGVFTAIGTPCTGDACDGACCLENTNCTITSRDTCGAINGTFVGALTTCPGAQCGACCIPGQPCTTVPDMAACTAEGGTYQGDGADCGAAMMSPCTAPCCYTDDITGLPNCMEVDEATCAALDAISLDGIYLPNNATCADTNCNFGSCCLPDGICQILDEGLCTGNGGLFQGAGSNCNPVPCPGACCIAGGICVLRTPVNCAAGGGAFQGEGSDCTDPLECAGACCLTESMVPCMALTEGQCDAQMGLYLGTGTTCAGSGATCDDIGACCVQQLPAPGAPDPPPLCIPFSNMEACVALEGVFYLLADCEEFICPPTGACCVGEEQCADVEELACAAGGGTFIGEGTTCAGTDCSIEPDCGAAITGNCFDVPGNGSAFCSDMACCQLICDADPWCCAEDPQQAGIWDVFCAAQANLMCQPNDPGMGADRCLSGANGSCFEAHASGGCNNTVCCQTVCFLLDFCCDGTWGPLCVQTALENCTALDPAAWPPPAVTPDYAPLQGYLTFDTYEGGDVPADLVAWTPRIVTDPGPPEVTEPFPGYDGRGWNMGFPGDRFVDNNGNGVFDAGDTLDEDAVSTPTVGEYDPPGGGEPFIDTNGNGWWDVGEAWTDQPVGGGNGVWDGPTGLYGLGQQLIYELGIDEIGQGNLTRGKTIKIGIIEFSFYTDPRHEDLTHVTLVPADATLFQNPNIDSPEHGTACLSIAAGLDNGFGVIGVAPDADPYFFPIVSTDDGPREMEAWFDALATFDAGDVISASYGPPPVNLNCVQSSWTMIRLAADLGITVCVAAGNSCFNLDDADDLGDSGGMVIGACSPGTPQYRLEFSNYCTAADNAIGNTVHVRAWGEAVASAGYGTLQIPPGSDPAAPNGLPPDVTRAYHAAFNGTSAASPQVAGLVACLQGLAKQFYGIPLQPEVIRGALGAPGTLPPNPTRNQVNGGFDPAAACGLDLNPEQGPNWIGVWPNVSGNGGAAEGILSSSPIGFDDAPLVEDVIIVRGTHIFGNRFSVKRAFDNNRFVVEAVATGRGNAGPPMGGAVGPRGPAGASFPELDQIFYTTQGDITDIAVIAKSDANQPQSLTVTVIPDDPGTGALMFVEGYNYQIDRWLFLGVSYLQAGSSGEDNFSQFTTANARQFIRSSDQRILIRCWSVGFTLNPFNIGGPRLSHRQRYDFINVEVGQSVGE